MNSPLPVPVETLRKQEQVSDPSVSAWVSANAGSGKTTVLVRRVIRLLLDGNPPARILCLTFTKAAAANMANKVLETLSRWVRLDDGALDAEISAVSPLTPTPALRATARRLFAQALETPGGLKVQTIHAFCDRVLHQFPMEARVQAGFEVLDDVQEADLLRRAREATLIDAANDPAGELGRALSIAVASASDDSFNLALAAAVRARRKVERLADLGGRAEIARALGLESATTVATVVDEILDGRVLPRSEWMSVAAALLPVGGNATKCGERLRQAAGSRDDGSAVEAYLSVFFTEKGEPRDDGGFGTKKARDSAPDLFARLLAERERMIALRERLYAARALERTTALVTLARATIARFEREKRARGALDYADLIEKTADMLADTGSAWVLYKLDGGIDHVLIDEAQDTSPEQWSVIEKLTEEFFAGAGARGRERTIFVVGDEKQSIFSFQGADPRLFGEKRDDFRDRVTKSGQTFHPVDLLLSFRSARGVLAAVDAVFERPQAYAGLSSGDRKNPIHEAIRSNAPALVEIWETEKLPDDADDSLPWDAPLDARGEASPVTRLAQRIADAIKSWTTGGFAIEDRKTGTLRVPRAGDAIVLVRQRGPLFDAILQALKKSGVPVAGADRLQLHEHIAVMDLAALGDALVLEADDLALACVLKSPLFGLTEDELFDLAVARSGTLAASLATLAQTNSRFAAVADRLARWRSEAAVLRPFDFYSRVLGRDRGRERMLTRLGLEAADAIDEFLARALAYEKTEAPSIAGFLNFLRRAGTEVKRDLEVESDAVRVMTAHGAKGLEAPLIILADTTSLPDGRQDRLLGLPDSEAFVWIGRKDFDSGRERVARTAANDLREAEYRRLLYVALTRAADALIVCGHEGRDRLRDGCWYRLVRDALEAGEPSGLVRTEVPYATEGVLRWRPERLASAEFVPPGAAHAITREAWLDRAATPAATAPRRITPSRFDPDDVATTASSRPSDGALDPRRRGDLVHRLLQHLPTIAVSERKKAAARFLATFGHDLNEAIHDSLAEEAIAVMGLPELAVLFGSQSRAEVELLAQIPGVDAREISGRVDRLAVTEDAVWFADFKTGKRPSDKQGTPGNYVKQFAVYRDVLARIYPDRAMHALLVWTEDTAIQEIPVERLDAAMAGIMGQITPT
jgi:ATP-dependent helicase/nuclease subunit A